MKGFLLVTMEPPLALEEEFNDWYDTEHLPERKAIDGFETAKRFVCVSGWPRYVALYDLRSVGVLDEPNYRRVSGEQFTPWSKRILKKVRGLWRAFGEQVYPGEALSGNGPRMLLIRYRNAPPQSEEAITEAVRTSFEGRQGIAQVRVMRSASDHGFDYLALIEASTPFQVGPCPALQGQVGRNVDVVNEYATYWFRGALPGVYARP
jgi:hypothetical protein